MSSSTIVTGSPNPDKWLEKVNHLLADGTDGPVTSILESEGVHNNAVVIMLVFDNYTGRLEGPLVKLTGTIRFDINPGMVWSGGSRDHILRFRMNMGGIKFRSTGDKRMSSNWMDSLQSNLQMSVVDKRTGTVVSQGLNTGKLSGVEAGLSVRLHVVPTSSSSANLHLSVFPTSLDKLMKVANARDLSLTDRHRDSERGHPGEGHDPGAGA